MTPEIDFAGRQIIGARRTQEDYYCFCQLTGPEDGLDGLLLVLADGMGGHAGGALASRLVVEAFIEHFCLDPGNIVDRLLGSLGASERRIREEIGRRQEYLSQMGSTLVGVVWTAGRLYWISVGDSPLYLYRDKKLTRLNADHSMVPVLEAKAARGEISAKQAAEDPERHLLRSAIAAEPPELYELRERPFELLAGDIILCATDGLATLDGKTLSLQLQTMAGEPAERIAVALLTAVCAAADSRQDNTTVAIIRNSVVQL
jgi:serine/threonine protein phosphatase PrpC